LPTVAATSRPTSVSGSRRRHVGRYSDGSIICGKPEHPPHDGQATTNPVLVLEVLSPSSEGDDQGDKRLDFQSLASLRAYIVASQDRQRIEVYRRVESGAWSPEPDVYVAGDSFSLPTSSAPLAVADIYRGILDPSGRSLLRGAAPAAPAASRVPVPVPVPDLSKSLLNLQPSPPSNSP
jgi:Uma2 family endonuclease